eukprot:TRINITY_DN83455_c0_g1_i1.p1 TRINITY_DN83455_c0_g1~~TRINITY_DN83455_c0_g1_i1.p1  ORF type:complete len:316 (+),score=71.71 TRINITY_DN83455_c0_g1_i1:92-1039(+)
MARFSIKLAAITLLVASLAQAGRIAEDDTIEPSLMQGRPGLKDNLLTQLLAICAADVYVPGQYVNGSGVLKLLFNSTKKETSAMAFFIDHEDVESREDIQFAFYEILVGAHKGETVMSIRGTSPLHSALDRQRNIDLHLEGPGEENTVTETIKILRHDRQIFAQLVNGDTPGGVTHASEVRYVTGHSLGGALAQIVAVEEGMEGAAFNPRAVCHKKDKFDWCQHYRDQDLNVPFEVHVTENDYIINLADATSNRFMMGPEIKHESRSNAKAHDMACLVINLGCPEEVQNKLCETLMDKKCPKDSWFGKSVMKLLR